jgi:hypothetical protein
MAGVVRALALAALGARAVGFAAAGFMAAAGGEVAAIWPDRLGRLGAALDMGPLAPRDSGLIVVAVCEDGGGGTAFSRVWETAGMAGTVGLPCSGLTASIERLLTAPLCQT